ncbi:MAG TPA: EAL domain-containing protein [Burkholderiaceae bacterium]|nr:EAL domain-containing protein [Burkholderiaceae bacterium]HNG80957.1 EAL domain-containing protein [Burkholderiaceae bacterium]
MHRNPSPPAPEALRPAATAPRGMTGERQAMMDAYYGASSVTLLAGAFGAALVVAMLAPHLPRSYLTVWLPAIELFFALRIGMVQIYRRTGTRHVSLQGWQHLAWGTTALQGLAWGAFSALVGVLPDPIHQMAVLVTAMVMVAGSAALIGALPVVVPVFGMLTMTPAIIGLLSWGDALHSFLAFCCLMFIATVNFSLPRTVQNLIRRLHLTAQGREQLLSQLQDAERMALVGHFVWDLNSNRVSLSEQACRMLGVPPGEAVSPRDVTRRLVDEERERVTALIRDALKEQLPELRYETRLVTAQGKHFHVQAVQRAEFGDDGRALRVMTTVQDVTAQISAQRELRDLAYSDPLTGLANRAAFQEQLDTAVKDCRSRLALLVLDLDHFKSVNDTLGHDAGDRLLVEAATRLKACLRQGDGLARLGGDEFAIVLPALDSSSVAATVAERLIAALGRPFRLGELELFVSCSVGIAMYPSDAATADALLRCADVAMFDAKSRGRAGYQFHDADQSARARERVQLDGDLRRAIERGELELFYQPKVRVSDGGVVGAEALLRWRRGGGALVPPDRFIPVAEDTGLIVPIGEWVLRSACDTALAWNRGRSAADGVLKIAVNLSPRQFWSPDFIGMVRAVLHDSGCRPEWIELEMTESLLIDSRGQVASILAELRQLGFTLAIDDFGTGYSALGYLTRFPITTLKIDRSFVAEVATQPTRAGIVRAVVGMGQSLGLELVAEGVEDAEQAAALRQMGCHLAQGWLYGRPVPRGDFERLHGLTPAPATTAAAMPREPQALPA